GMFVQTIMPALAAGLHLPLQHGLIVSDVTDGKPAAAAGLQIGDLIDTLDGQPIDSVLALALRLFVSNGTEHVRVGGMRGGHRFVADVGLIPHATDLTQLTDLIDPDTSVVPSLGI